MFVVGGLALALAAPAGADNFALRARPAGIQKLVELAPSQLPTSLDFEPIQGVILSCPIVEDFSGFVDPHTINIQWNDFDLQVTDGGLDIALDLDLDIAADLDVTNLICISDVSCDIEIAAQHLTGDIHLSLVSGPNGIQVGDVNVDLDIHKDNFELDIHGCLIGDGLETVVQWVEGWALNKLMERLEGKAEALVPDKIAALLSSSLPLHVEAGGFHIDAAIEQLLLGEGTGLDLVADAEVTWMGGDESTPDFEEASGEALPGYFGPGDFAVAAGDDLVGRVLYEGWRGGLFKALLSKIKPSITLSEEGLAQKLGLPGGTNLEVSLDLEEAPEVTFGRNEGKGLHIGLPGLKVLIDIAPPGGQPGHVEISTIASLDVGFEVDGEAGTLQLVVQGLKVDKLDIVSGDEVMRADPARLEQFIGDVGAPMLAAQLAGLPLSPALRPSPELEAFVWLRTFETEDGWLRAGLDLHTPDPNDGTAPDTTAEIPEIVRAGMALIPVGGTDDVTPGGLMRFNVSIDGKPVHPEPKFMSAARVSMEEGNHIIEVAAVDLNGNVDSEPVRREVVVDGTPPTLTVKGAPKATLQDSKVELSWRASDERTGVTTRWELREFGSRDQVGKIIKEGDAGEAGTVSLTDFDNGSIYVVRVIASDEAGNLTSEEFGFGLEQGGCNAGGGTSSTWLVFGLLGLMLLRKRRQGLIAALACFAIASPAMAQSIGSTFSGVTDADGSSAFWNPAAMHRGDGTRVDVGSGVSLIRIGFTEEGQAEGSNTFIPKPSPTLGAFTDAIGKNWRVGLSVGIPSAAGADWDREDPAGGTTRYYAEKAKNFYVSATPAASFRPASWISIGAGVDLVYGRLDADFDKDMAVQLNRSVGSGSADSPFPSESASLAAPVSIRTGGFGVGAVGGILLQPRPWIAIGTSVHSPVTVKASGSLDVEYPAAMRAFIASAAPTAELPEMAADVNIDLKMPLSVFSAISVNPAKNWEVRLDHRFMDYSSVANADLLIAEATSPDIKDTALVKGFRDVHSVGLRLSRVLMGGRGQTALIGRWESNKVPELVATPSNVDFNKYELGAAVQWMVSRRVSVIGQYAHFFIADRTVDENLHRTTLDANLDAYNHPAPMGTYRAASDTLSVYLSAFY